MAGAFPPCKQYPNAASEQPLSHAVLQHAGSNEQTVAQQFALLQPGSTRAVKQLPAPEPQLEHSGFTAPGESKLAEPAATGSKNPNFQAPCGEQR